MSSLNERLRQIQYVVTDCDGVLTNGTLYIGDEGEEIKGFHAHDGAAFKYLQRSGFRVVLVSGRDSDALTARAEELGVDQFFPGTLNKGDVCQRVKEDDNVSKKQLCYIGDDLSDLSGFSEAGVTVTVQNGRDELKERADFVVGEQGGNGAFRLLAERLLRAQNKWEKVVDRCGQPEK